jgi:hypothetical protein
MAEGSNQLPSDPIPARLDSRCPGCLGFIHQGQPIYYVEHQWVCEQCYYAARRAGARA